ncbi:response regulator [Massilia timonae]|uniref:histidine kinase n=2 Tax=Massilia timonae TaxID=47229 RepID=A0A1S2NGE3_9BURK|nr:response regulator [Massilia timonae]
MIGSLTGAGVEVNIHVSDQECLIDADPSQFDTALVNLAVNARDAMRARGTLTVRVEVVEAIPATKTRGAVDGEFVAVSLADTGTGIAPEHLEKIFEPFFTTKGVGHGTGLGLSQVFGFAHQSGGDVRVQSAPGAGSTFTLYLPRARAARVALAATRKAADLPSGDGVNVLAVEDNPELAAVVDTMLQELGYASVVVPSAERALELLREEPDRFAAVFSDVMLPGMNGIDLANAIAESGIGAAVVLSSGYSQALVQNPNHGFVLLAKPYALADLARALHAAVHRLDPPAGQEQPDMATVYD